MYLLLLLLCSVMPSIQFIVSMLCNAGGKNAEPSYSRSYRRYIVDFVQPDTPLRLYLCPLTTANTMLVVLSYLC
uniref:Secreted protein n=1 Tax=Arundo donax TaxID=35708 RepID=A0A0A9HGK8_ARUDO